MATYVEELTTSDSDAEDKAEEATTEDEMVDVSQTDGREYEQPGVAMDREAWPAADPSGRKSLTRLRTEPNRTKL